MSADEIKTLYLRELHKIAPEVDLNEIDPAVDSPPFWAGFDCCEGAPFSMSSTEAQGEGRAASGY